MAKLPLEIRQYSKQIAAMNPAFEDWKAARRSLKNSYDIMTRAPDIESVTTGGYMLRRDGEGYIELWISPYSLWKGKL